MKQRHNECLLAAACRLASVDYETASDVYTLEYGTPWGAIDSGVTTASQRIETMHRRRVFLVKYIDQRYGNSALDSFFNLELETDSTGTTGTTGLGIIRTQSARHAVVVNPDGSVWDPQDDIKYPSMDALLKALAYSWTKWKVETIIDIGA